MVQTTAMKNPKGPTTYSLILTGNHQGPRGDMKFEYPRFN
jgi:hypothetical protein